MGAVLPVINGGGGAKASASSGVAMGTTRVLASVIDATKFVAEQLRYVSLLHLPFLIKSAHGRLVSLLSMCRLAPWSILRTDARREG
jgi:hypothetical protein